MYSVWVAILIISSITVSKEPDFIEVLTPSGHIAVSVNHIHVVGRSSAPVIRVTLNGREIEDLKVVDTMFHAHLNYGYGLNEIRLVPLSEDSTITTGETVVVQVLYGPTIPRKYRRVFTEFRFHDATVKEVCIRCHGGASEDLSEISDDTTCLDCHRDFRDRFVKHIKVENSTCMTCHRLDNNLSASRGGPDGSNICYQCHIDKIGEYSQEFIHGPVASGGCVVCHDPHGSQYEKNLKSPQNVLCFSCHVDMEDELSREFVHEPFAEGKCGGCHDPHATANKWVLLKSSEEICLNCHGEQGSLTDHGHPYNVAPSKPLRVNLELTERGTLECISCHDPHATDAGHLLKIPGRFNCVACHDDK